DFEFRHLVPRTNVSAYARRSGRMLCRRPAVFRLHPDRQPVLLRDLLRRIFLANPAASHQRMKRALLAWSSGKDSAWSLHLLRQRNEYEIAGLLTTFNREADRVAMHGVRRALVQAQAAAVGIPLWEVDLPWPCSNENYEAAMLATCKKAVASGIEC